MINDIIKIERGVDMNIKKINHLFNSIIDDVDYIRRLTYIIDIKH